MNRLTSQPETPLNSFNLAFIEELYVSYLRDPSSVPPDWRRYFEQFSQDDSIDETRLGPSFRPTSFFNPAGRADGVRPGDAQLAKLQNRVDLLIRNFRVRGHLIARLDPLDRPRPHLPELDPKFYGFTEADMERRFSSETLHRDGPLTLREILERLRNTYCRSIGVQFMHIDDLSCKEMAAGAHGRHGKPPQAQPRRADPHPDPPDRRGHVRRIHSQEIHRREELFAGRRRRA